MLLTHPSRLLTSATFRLGATVTSKIHPVPGTMEEGHGDTPRGLLVTPPRAPVDGVVPRSASSATAAIPEPSSYNYVTLRTSALGS